MIAFYKPCISEITCDRDIRSLHLRQIGFIFFWKIHHVVACFIQRILICKVFGKALYDPQHNFVAFSVLRDNLSDLSIQMNICSSINLWIAL